MKDYFKNLSESILDTFNAWEDINIEVDMEELEVDIDKAVPIGLIVNELITNACKYAFPNKDISKGNILIALKQENNNLQLIVSDDGIGKEKDAPNKGTGFGSQLIDLLTRQLNGEMKEEVGQGTTFTFDFKLT